MFELLNITELNDLKELIHIVKNKINVKEYVDTYNRTPLYLLCMNKKAKKEQIIELVHLLIKKGVDIQKKYIYKETNALFPAIETDKNEVISILIENGIKINKEEINCACYKYNYHLMFYLLEIYEKQNNIIVNKNHNYIYFLQEILCYICGNNYENEKECKTIKKLIEKGAKLNEEIFISDSSNETYINTPLNEACFNGCLEKMKYLVSLGANVNYKEEGEIPLFKAIEYNKIEIAKWLIHNGTDLSIKNKVNQDLLYISASHKNNDEITLLLIEKGVYIDLDIKYKNNYNNTLLHLACLYNQQKLALYLIEKNINENVLNDIGNSAFHYACLNGLLEVVEVLINKNVNINLLNNKNYSPLYYATKYKKYNIIQLLFDNGVYYDKKICNIINNYNFYTYKNILLILIKHGYVFYLKKMKKMNNINTTYNMCNINTRKNNINEINTFIYNLWEKTPLLKAMYYNKLGYFKKLIYKKYRKILFEKLYEDIGDGWTISHACVFLNKIDFMKIIWEFNKNSLFISANNGLTPLMIASSKGYIYFIELLNY
jgi:ankyrin repeat protein